MKNKNPLVNDVYRRARGSYTRLLEIFCRKCGSFLAHYQKDGSGNLRRMYLDRIFYPQQLTNLQNKKINELPPLQCQKCKEILGTPYVYDKENRKAFRLYVDAVVKKIKRLKRPVDQQIT